MRFKTSLRDRAATALDLLRDKYGRGPKTWNAVERVAAALDGVGKLKSGDVEWLEHVVDITRSNPRRNPGRVRRETATVTGFIVIEIRGQAVEFEYEATLYGSGAHRADEVILSNVSGDDIDPYEDLTSKQLERAEQMAFDDAYEAVKHGDYE